MAEKAVGKVKDVLSEGSQGTVGADQPAAARLASSQAVSPPEKQYT